jgi:hypothetical protein
MDDCLGLDRGVGKMVLGRGKSDGGFRFKGHMAAGEESGEKERESGRERYLLNLVRAFCGEGSVKRTRIVCADFRVHL